MMEYCTGACSFGKFQDALTVWSALFSLITCLVALAALNIWKKEKKADVAYDLFGMILDIRDVLHAALPLCKGLSANPDPETQRAIQKTISAILSAAESNVRTARGLVKKSRVLGVEDGIVDVLEMFINDYLSLNDDIKMLPITGTIFSLDELDARLGRINKMRQEKFNTKAYDAQVESVSALITRLYR